MSKTTPLHEPLAADTLDWSWIELLIGRARLEDVGAEAIDVTTACSVPATATCHAKMCARQSGRLAGSVLLPRIIEAYDANIEFAPLHTDGDAVQAGQVIATFDGQLASILAMERVALNFICHLSGIASLTNQFVEIVRGTKAAIFDTRKTLPGWRDLAKYAVRCGGGRNHRMGLHDAVLIKDNHIAHIPTGQLSSAMAEAIANARQSAGGPPSFVEVEVDTLEQFDQVLRLDVDVILLDNMSTVDMAEAVARRDAVAPKVQLEASGSVNLDSARAIAETGVDRIAIGALTHSVTALDIGLDIAPVH